MVNLNGLKKRDGNHHMQGQRPRKFLFSLGVYDVSATTEGAGFTLLIWDAKQVIGTINLGSHFRDVASIFAIDTKIDEEYQGIGIAYRAYEGLLLRTNIALATANQSLGAVKLWRRFATHRSMAIYFVVGDPNSLESRLFDSMVYPVELHDGQLYAIIDETLVDPYATAGSLLLVRRNRPLDEAIHHHMAIQTQRANLRQRFQRYDQPNLVAKRQ